MKKKLILITILVLLLVPAFVFLVPVKDGRTIYKTIKYNKLLANATQPGNYDKMKVSYVQIANRKTGTAPWDSTSDMNGNDSSTEDDYVRTFDTVEYFVEVGVALNLNHPDVVETTQLNGGVIKVRATIPEVNGEVYFVWVEEAWMKNIQYSNNGRTITVEYRVPTSETIVGGNQQLSFRMTAMPYEREFTVDQTPTFEVWMEGNKPDNESSSAELKAIQDNKGIIVTGRDDYRISVNTTEEPPLSISSVKDGKKGQYFNFNLHSNLIYRTGGNYAGGLFPERDDYNNAIIEVKLKYSYRDHSSDNGEYIPVEVDNLNGIQLIAYNKINELNDNAFPRSDSNAITYWNDHDGEHTSTYAGNTISQNYGTISATIDGDILRIKINDFYSNYFRDPIYGNRTQYQAKMLFYYSFEFFLPYYVPVENSSYDYKFDYEIISAKLVDEEENEKFDILSTDDHLYDNKNFYSFKNYLSGDIRTFLYSDITFHKYSQNSQEDAYTYEGAINTITSELYLNEGPYLGGEERLITFDASMLDLVKKDDKWFDYKEKNTEQISEDTPIDNQVILYGIYKANPNIGLNSLALVNSTLKDDFDWYNTPEEASQHGKITAIYWNNPDYDGQFKNDKIFFYVKAVDTDRDEGKVATLRQKVWLYSDVARTQKYEIYTSTSENYFIPSTYGEGYKKLSRGTPYQAGEGILIIKGYLTMVSSGKTVDNENHYKTVFNVQDEKFKFIITTKGTNVDGTIDDYDNITIGTTYNGKYLTLMPETCNYPVIYDEQDYLDLRLVKWKVENYKLDELPVDIKCDFIISPYTPHNTELEFSVRAVPYTDKYNNNGGFENTYLSHYVTILNLSGSSTRISTSKELIDLNDSYEVEGALYNISDESLNNVKTIELLPKDGDSLGSIIHGSYTIKVNELADGMTIYYATGDLNDIGIVTDALGYKTIKDVDLANDSNWIQVQVGDTIPDTATAIATLTDTIPTNTSKGFSYQVITDGNQKGDVYYFGQYASSDNLVENIFSTYKSVTVVDRKISGTVFEDLNRNDELNDTDAKENDYLVELLDESGNKISDTRTNSEGYYEFAIEKGKYYVRFANIPDGYELTPKGTSDNQNKVNANLTTDLIDHTQNARDAIEMIGNINLGMRKKPATLVTKYLDKVSGEPLATQTETTVYYTDTYETQGLTNIPENYSFLENAGDPVSEVVNKDYIEVIYYYDLTPATVTARHYLDGTTTKIHEDVVQNKKFTQPYETSALDTTNMNYEYVRRDGDDAAGTVSKTSYVVNYYYKYKTGTVTTHHYLYDNGDTTTKLAPDVSKTWNYTDTYTTSTSSEVPSNYEFYKKSDNFTAVMSSPSVEVNYYYRLKDSNLTTSITKTGTEEITDKNAEVNYTITYNAKVTDYIGSGTITIVDNLPYKIDESASNLDGGTYNDSNKTITWTINWSDIDTYNNKDEYAVTKNITLKYVGIVGRDRVMTNTTKGTITLSNNSRESQAQTSTNIRIKGKIKVTYTDKDTGEELFDPIEEEDLVGEQFISSAQEKDGYKLVTKPDSEEFEFEEEEQLIKYEYEHIKFEIKGVVLGVGGTITGDEDVFWGEDSTVDNIVVQADEGYIIEAIIVNGERIELVLGEEKVILNNFVNVLEDKNIEVVFAKKPQENPNTKASLGWLLFFSWIVAGIAIILIKKTKELE